MFFNTIKGSVTSFSILFNFQGPVRLSLAADSLIILSRLRSFVKHFFSEARKLFSRHEIDLSGPIFLLLSLSEVILSGGPWRSSIIPYAGAGVNTFLQISLHFSIRKPLFLAANTKRPSVQLTQTAFYALFSIIRYIKDQRISMPSLNFRLPRIFLTARSTCSADRSSFRSERVRANAMLFLPSPRLAPR